MPAIKSAEWLLEQMSKNNMVPSYLALLTRVETKNIQKILKKEKFGSIKEWDAVYKVFPNKNPLVLKDKSLKYEVLDDIYAFGNEKICFAYYRIEDGNVLFEDYLLPEDIENGIDEQLAGYSQAKMTLKELLSYLKEQTKYG